jgi:prophage regulatory protein
MKNSMVSLDKVYFLSLNQTCEVVNLSRSTIYRKVKDGSFPKTVQLSPNRVGFRTSDLKKWVGGVK